MCFKLTNGIVQQNLGWQVHKMVTDCFPQFVQTMEEMITNLLIGGRELHTGEISGSNAD
jgi:hypothetical protein